MGCGACASICPEGNVRLLDVEKDGIRPFVNASNCKACGTCLKVCPGIHNNVTWNFSGNHPGQNDSFKRWGNVLEFWEGFASDPEVRFKGSSGGLCTALSLYCLDQGIAGGVLHIGADPEVPWKNRTFRSTCREEIIERTGSRYCPASPCEALRWIEQAPDRSVFIGKPCDVDGFRHAQKLRLELSEKTCLAIGFFCAGTPSTSGTLELFRQHGVNPNKVDSFRCRGMGWPGMATLKFKDPGKPLFALSYQESWGFVQKYRQFRCYLCPDLTAELSDISVGDPWYREIGEDEPGRSLVLIRTAKGREIFHQAMAKGYVSAERIGPEIIYRSQKNLLTKRQAIWGRLLAMKLMGIPTPKLEGFHLFENWLDLPFGEKFRSVGGTLRRIIQRKYYKRKKTIDRL